MAVYTAPGVYIEEVASGVRTITGVSTSTTAFVGRTWMGPVDQPVQISSFGEFTSIFGGLWDQSPLSYSVQQFFANGGQIAVIVRIARNEGVAKFSIPGKNTDKLVLDAANPGIWANSLTISVDDATDNPAEHFNLTVRNLDTGGTEVLRNLSADPKSSRYLKPILARQSRFLRVTDDSKVKQPLPTGQSIEFTGEPKDGTFTLTLPWLSGTKSTTAPIKYGAAASTVESKLEELDGVDASDVKVTDGAAPKSYVVKFGGQFSGQPLPLMGITSALDPPTVIATVSASVITATSNGSTKAKEGEVIQDLDVVPASGRMGKQGIYLLEHQDIFNLLVIPPFAFDQKVGASTWSAAATYCNQKRAFLIIDPPPGTINPPANATSAGLDDLGFITDQRQYSALFFPRFRAINPLTGLAQEFAPSGAIAGIMARTDADRGVWKAPAGLDAGFSGILELSYKLTEAEIGTLNQLGVNCLRTFRFNGSVVWGARTLDGNDAFASEWKYTPVRRLALFIEESLFRGTQWVVFEPNDEPLWSQIRLNIGAFMHDLFRQGAFQGASPRDAYFVKCDSETTTQTDIDLGIVNIQVGFAPLKPAEFVVIQIQQMAGQIQV